MASSGSFNTSGWGSGDYNRYLTFSWSVQSQSVSSNRTTISWELRGAGGAGNTYVEAGNFKVTIAGTVVYSSSGRIQLWNGTSVASGTLKLYHDDAGKCSFSASAEAGIYYYAVNCSGSGSWSLPTIARKANITSAPNFKDTDNPTIGYSNPAGTSVASLQACIANPTGSVIYVPYRNISRTGTSYTFNLTEAERNALLAACPNSKTLAVKFYVTTVISGQTYYSTEDRTMTVVDANPTFSTAYADDNATTVAITGNDQQIIRNQSQLEVNISNADAKKSATLASATCVINGNTYNASFSGDSATFNVGLLNVSSNTNAQVTVTDSRGYSTTTELPITVLDWQLPTAIVDMQRHNNYYTPTDITVDGSYSSVDGKNSMTLKVRYKKVSNSTWSTYTTVQDNVATTFQLDNEYAWDVQVLVQDLFGSTTYNLVLDRGMPIIYFDRILSSVGINCFPASADALEVNGVNITRSVMTRSLLSNLSNLSVNTYTKINLTGTNSFGSQLTASNDGGIKIGAGVSKILVSGRMLLSSSVVGSSYIRICANSTDTTLAWVTHTNQSTGATFESIDITPTLVDVNEGDVIYLYYYVPASSGTIYGTTFGSQTSLTVETVG